MNNFQNIVHVLQAHIPQSNPLTSLWTPRQFSFKRSFNKQFAVFATSMYVNCYKIKWLARPRLSRKWCWGFGWGVCFVYLRAGTVRINFLKNAFFNSEYERIDGFQWFALHGKYLCIIDCWHAFVVCPGELTESITSAFHLLPLPITVPTRFPATWHHGIINAAHNKLEQRSSTTTI